MGANQGYQIGPMEHRGKRNTPVKITVQNPVEVLGVVYSDSDISG